MRANGPAVRAGGEDSGLGVMIACAALFLAALIGWLQVAAHRARARLRVRDTQLAALAALQLRSGAVGAMDDRGLHAVDGMFPGAKIVWTKRGDAMFLTFAHDAGRGECGAPAALGVR